MYNSHDILSDMDSRTRSLYLAVMLHNVQCDNLGKPDDKIKLTYSTLYRKLIWGDFKPLPEVYIEPFCVLTAYSHLRHDTPVNLTLRTF